MVQGVFRLRDRRVDMDGSRIDKLLIRVQGEREHE
jgi:hypothetical protein